MKNLPGALLLKWSPEVVDEGFVPFPKKLLRVLHQIFKGEEAMEELAVILAIVDYRRPNLTRPPSCGYLAFLAGLPDGRVREILKTLEAKELIKCMEGPIGIDVDIDGILQKIQSLTDDESVA